MKKFRRLFLLSLIIPFLSCGCNKKEKSIEVYAPDGAPALGLVSHIKHNDDSVNYHIVDSSTIISYVTGEDPIADIAIVPINICFAQQSIYENYKILGSITHGNLFMLSYSKLNISLNNLDVLIGKKVGCVNLANFPGLIFKMILNDNNIPFYIVENDGKIDENSVNLYSIDSSQVGNDETLDYYIAPEPLATVKTTALSKKDFRIVGSLQDMYNSSSNYPQALLICRKNLIESKLEFVRKFTSDFEFYKNELNTLEIDEITSIVNSKLTSGLAPTFNEKNLNKTVISNCNIYFKTAKNDKENIQNFVVKASQIMPLKTTFLNYYFEE